MVHICNGILPSHKGNMFESALMRWMILEPIIQSEVSKKEKSNHIYKAKMVASVSIIH